MLRDAAFLFNARANTPGSPIVNVVVVLLTSFSIANH